MMRHNAWLRGWLKQGYDMRQNPVIPFSVPPIIRLLQYPFIALMIAMTGCAVWKPMATPLAVDPRGDQAFQVWTAERSYALYELHISRDSITGIPLIDDRHCRECRVAIKRADVDSIQVGDPATGTVATFAVAGTAVFGFMGVMLLLYRIGAFGAD
jgi:hypothetical protein